MRPLLVAALVATSVGVASAGPIVVSTPRSDDPGAALILASFADSRRGIALQENILGDLSHTFTTPAGGRYAVRFDSTDDQLADVPHAPFITWEPRGLLLCATAAEPARPFSGNPAIEPRPADDRPLPGEPLELFWLVVFGSLVVGGIVAVQRRFSARSG